MSKSNETPGVPEEPNPLVGFVGTYFRPANSEQHYELSIPFGLQRLLEHVSHEDLTKLHEELNEVCDLFTEHVVDKIDSKDFKRKYKVLKGLQGFVNDLFIKIEIEH